MPLLYATGALQDEPDPKDYPYHLASDAIKTRGRGWPVSIDNRTRYPAPLNQHHVPACVGMAGAIYAMMVWWALLGDEAVELSPRALYEWSKRKDHVPGRKHRGTTLRALCKVLTKWGACPEDLWRWDPDSVGHPAMWARAAAWKYRFARYERLDFDQLPHAIHRFNGVLVTLLIHPGWNKPLEEHGFLIQQQEPERETDLHAAVLHGYDENEAFFWVRNSWGPWGLNGDAKLSFRDVKENLRDAWVVVPRWVA